MLQKTVLHPLSGKCILRKAIEKGRGAGGQIDPPLPQPF